MANRKIPAIIVGVISPFNQTTAYGVATSRRDFHEVCTFLNKEIATGATRRTAGVLKDPPVKNWKDRSGTIPVDKNTVEISPRTTTKVLTGTGPSASPIRSRAQGGT